MKTHRFLYALGVLILFSYILSACALQPMQAPSTEPKPAIPETPTKVKAQILPLLSFAPYFIAQEEGYFAEQGLDVEFVQFQRSSDAIPALIQGELDVIGGTTSFSLLNAIAKSGNIRLVADKGYITATGCSHHSILASQEMLASGRLADGEQLRGRRFAFNPSAVQGYFIDQLLAERGLIFDDIEIVDVADPVIGESLANGAIDFASVSEPWVTRIVQSGVADVWITAGEFVPDFQLGVISYGPNLLVKNVDAGQRFMLAYLKAVEQYNQGKTPRNLEILAQYTELDLPLLQATCWPTMRANGEVNEPSLLEFERWGRRRGLLDAEISGNQLIDRRFIDFANDALATTAR